MRMENAAAAATAAAATLCVAVLLLVLQRLLLLLAAVRHKCAGWRNIVAGSLNLIPVFSFSSIKHDLSFMHPLAALSHLPPRFTYIPLVLYYYRHDDYYYHFYYCYYYGTCAIH